MRNNCVVPLPNIFKPYKLYKSHRGHSYANRRTWSLHIRRGSPFIQNISHEICTRFCFVLMGCGCILSGDSYELFTKMIYKQHCVYPGEKNTKMTLELAQKQFVTRVYIWFNFIHDITNPEITIKRLSSHIVAVSHSLSFRSADGVTIDCW